MNGSPILDGHPEDLIDECPRGACGLSNDILDLGPDRLGPVLGGSKNPEKIFGHFWTPLKSRPGDLDPSLIYHWKAQKLL